MYILSHQSQRFIYHLIISY